MNFNYNELKFNLNQKLQFFYLRILLIEEGQLLDALLLFSLELLYRRTFLGIKLMK